MRGSPSFSHDSRFVEHKTTMGRDTYFSMLCRGDSRCNEKTQGSISDFETRTKPTKQSIWRRSRCLREHLGTQRHEQTIFLVLQFLIFGPFGVVSREPHGKPKHLHFGGFPYVKTNSCGMVS